jgi:hypothetical protein
MATHGYSLKGAVKKGYAEKLKEQVSARPFGVDWPYPSAPDYRGGLDVYGTS